jgi:hypothetical protein
VSLEGWLGRLRAMVEKRPELAKELCVRLAERLGDELGRDRLEENVRDRSPRGRREACPGQGELPRLCQLLGPGNQSRVFGHAF